MLELIGIAVFLGMASAAASTTIAQSELFDPLRARVKSKWPWGGKLISCPYCLGHWVSMWAAFGFCMQYSGWPGLFSFLLLWLAATTASAIFSGLIGLLF